jgi:predicted alpha/beta-fold hydrolase
VLTSTRSERRIERRVLPPRRLQTLLALLFLPIGLFIGILTAIARIVRRAAPLDDEPELELVETGERLRDVRTFAEEVACGEFLPRWGNGALDFQLAYAPDLVPSLLDLHPKVANRFFACPPPFRRITIEALDGTPIAAEVAVRDDRPRPGLVVAHGTFGSSGQRIYSDPAIRAFSEWGFNVAVIDLRGWGRSSTLSEAPTTGGWLEALDVLGAARWLLDHGSTTVGAMGYSLGGAAVLLAATHDLAPSLLASGVFSESGFVDARDVMRIADERPGVLTPEMPVYLIFRYGLGFKMRFAGARCGLPEYLETVAAPHYGVTPDDVYDRDTVLDRVAEIRVPAFHLHAEDDWVVHVEHAHALRDAAERTGNRLVGVCIQPRGGHCAFALVAKEWRNRVARDFFAATSGVRAVEKS